MLLIHIYLFIAAPLTPSQTKGQTHRIKNYCSDLHYCYHRCYYYYYYYCDYCKVNVKE